jgi:hypothetical protein
VLTLPPIEAVMPIDTTFAITASPQQVFAALERDLMGAREHEGSTFEVLDSRRPESLDLRVTIGGIPCRLRYRITGSDDDEDHCEANAALTPYGWRYVFFKIITLGMRDQNFKVMLVEGLANLKAEVEGPPEADDDLQGAD